VPSVAGGIGKQVLCISVAWDWCQFDYRRHRSTPNANAKDQQDEGDPRKSFSFSGIQNVSRAGVPVPVVYGETLVGSVVISAGIDIVQVSA
jgi:hypothetical protein